MPRPKQTVTQEPESGPKPVTPAVLDTLGVRHVTRMVTKDVQATHPDGSLAFTDKGPLMTRREMQERIRLVQSRLTLEEAQKLGSQKWTLKSEGDWTCIVNGRRFILDQETYEELCQA